MTLASEQLLTGEESVVATAATEAVDLAREALELAKNAVQVMGKNLVVEVENLGSSSDAETEWLERMSFTGTVLVSHIVSARSQIAEHAENIAVRSGHQTERRARRARAAEKATTGVISLKSGLSGRKLEAVMLTPKTLSSLDQKIGFNESLKSTDVIAHHDAETSEDILIKQLMRQDLNKVLDTLNPREKQVVRWRFGLEDARMETLQEIGEY